MHSNIWSDGDNTEWHLETSAVIKENQKEGETPESEMDQRKKGPGIRRSMSFSHGE